MEALDQIKQDAAYILNSWTLGLREAQFVGRNSYFDNFRDAYRIHYLYGLIDAVNDVDGTLYLGDQEITLTELKSTFSKLWHYRGVWVEGGLYGSSNLTDTISDVIDDSNTGGIGNPSTGDIIINLPPTITQDAGDGDSNTGTGGDVPNVIVYESTTALRAGSQAVAIGSNFITFYLNGVATPLDTTDYVVTAFVTTSSGRQQNNLVISSKLANGFQVDDILEAGVIYYHAIPTT